MSDEIFRRAGPAIDIGAALGGGHRVEKLGLFRVDNSGVTYWVLGESGTPEEMMSAIEACEMSDGLTFADEGWEPLVASDIQRVREADARKTVCRMDCEADTDMWTAAVEHADTGHGRVVACSEW